jgi:hypothetical protein
LKVFIHLQGRFPVQIDGREIFPTAWKRDRAAARRLLATGRDTGSIARFLLFNGRLRSILQIAVFFHYYTFSPDERYFL